MRFDNIMERVREREKVIRSSGNIKSCIGFEWRVRENMGRNGEVYR